MSSTGTQETTTSKEEEDNSPKSIKTVEKDEGKTPGESSESGCLSTSVTPFEGSGDHLESENPSSPGIENSKISPIQATVQNLPECPEEQTKTVYIDNEKQFLDDDEENLLKSDDETDRNSIDGGGDAKPPKSGEFRNPVPKIDEKGDAGFVKSTYHPNSQDIDSLSSELQDEEMILKWDDDDEAVDLNPDLEIEILTEKTDSDNVTSTIDVTKSEDTEVIEKDLLTEIDAEVSAAKEKTTEKRMDENKVTTNDEQDKDLDNTMEVDTNETVDSLIANLDQIIDDDIMSNIVTNNINVSCKTVDLSEDPNANLAQTSDAVTPIKPEEMEVDASYLKEDKTVVTKNENKQAEIASSTEETTHNEMEVDISTTSEADILLSEEIDEKSVTIPADITQIDSNKSNIDIEKNSAKCDVKDAEPKTIDAEDLIMTSSGNDSMDLSVIEAREHGLNEPNMMIEIPTQEIIDIDSSIDISNTDSGSSEIDTSTVDNDKLLEQKTEKDIIENKDSEKPDSTNANDSLVPTEVEKQTAINVIENSDNNVTTNKEAVTKMEEENPESVKETTNEPSTELFSPATSVLEDDSQKTILLPTKELEPVKAISSKVEEQVSKDEEQLLTSIATPIVEQVNKLVDQASKDVEKQPIENEPVVDQKLPSKKLEIPSQEQLSKEVEQLCTEVEKVPKVNTPTEEIEKVPIEVENSSKEVDQSSSSTIDQRSKEVTQDDVNQPSKEIEIQPSTSNVAETVEQLSKNDDLAPKGVEIPSEDVALAPEEEKSSKEIELPSKDLDTQSSTSSVTEMIEQPSKEDELRSQESELHSKDIEALPSTAEVTEQPLKDQAPDGEKPIEMDVQPSTSVADIVDQSSKFVEPPSKDIETPSKDIESSSKDIEQTSKELEPSSKEIEVQPSTSFMTQMAPDTSDEVPEVTDSLGLLAESSRVMEDDEEQETSDHDDGDDDDDFDPDDESSNQMAGEHSEDSSAHHSESDLPKEQNLDGQEFTETNVDSTDNREFNFAISEVTSETTGEKVVVNNEIDLSDEVDDTSDTNAEEDQMDQAVESMDAVSSTVDTEEKDTHEEEPQTEMDTVKLSDTSDNEEDKTKEGSILRSILKQEDNAKEDKIPQSPSKSKKLEISKPKHVVNIVDLGESSSEDDIQEVKKEAEPDMSKEDVTSVNISGQIEIMSSGENTSNIVTKKGEIVISGVPKPKIPHKPARLNTSEVTIKTANLTESTLVIPETKINDKTTENSKPKFSLEVFSLDSDDEDTIPAIDLTPSKTVKLNNKCINILCRSDNSVPYYKADSSAVAFYEANKKKKPMVCQPCAEVVVLRAQSLVEGIKNFTPLLDLEMGKLCQELVEISDSDDEDDGEGSDGPKETIGEHGALILEEKLASMLNETWIKFNMDVRLKEAEDELNSELKRLEDEGKEVDDMLNECQLATDKLRNDLYGTFEQELQELPAVVIFDTPESVFTCLESAVQIETRQSKRRLASASETPPAKRPAIPLGYTPLDGDATAGQATGPQDTKPAVPAATPIDTKIDDDKDISVVTLSAEAAPPDLPPPGEVKRPPLFVGALVYAMRNAFGSWVKARITEYIPKDTNFGTPFSMCRIKLENKAAKTISKQLPARCLAYSEPSDVRLTIGTRIIALFKDTQIAANSKHTSFSSGVVAEIPNPVNNYRYLVFFDDGYAQYVRHGDTRLVCESSPLVWEEVHPFSREFVREYLLAYPERPMVRLHTGQSLKTEWKGKWWVSRVIAVDASLVHVHFEEDDRTEWIYRGSTRLAPLYLELQAAERHRARPLPRNRAQARTNMPYVEYTRSDEQAQKSRSEAQAVQAQQDEIRRQRSVAKKSTVAAPAPAPHPAPHPAPAAGGAEPVTSRVVYYTPKNAVKPYRMTTHVCSPKCKRSDVLALADLRTYNPLAKPLLSGWERQIVRYKGHKDVMYRAPCGRRLRSMQELHRYLRAIRSDMGVDLFDFGPNTHCLAEFVLNKCLVGKKDLSNGKENVPVPCVNYYDDALPEFCSYNTERTPTAGVPLNLDPDFLCGCDCTDDCEDKSKCACWKMTLEGARTIGLKGQNVGYVYKRLPEPLPSGIYECNSRCKCKSTCLNRVAQHPLQLKLQVFKTLNRGWGIRSLNDVPKGSFLCVYAGNLLTDATANLDGLNEGDEYLAELDYIEVVEQMKEGFEEDIPDADKKLDKKESGQDSDDEDEEESSSEEEEPSKNEKRDGDFEPGFLASPGITEFSKRLRKRNRVKKEKEDSAAAKKESAKENSEEDCITISDDEEVREPSRFTAQAGMGANKFVSKYKSVRSYFGKDEACYIMDAKVQGNIGRYLNHSCCPNVFVQNVFVDTHDPRFPWVSFFAASHIRAGTELTWNYNYDIGSVPGKILYCYCGAPNCRGRLL